VKFKLNSLSLRSGAIILALLTGLLSACNGADEQVGGPTADTNVQTGEVVDDTDQLIGKQVSIRSEVVEKIAPSTFTVNDQVLLGGENILVVNATGETFALPEGDEPQVQVTGTVDRFVLADVNREYDLDLEPDLYIDYEGRPAVIAQSLALAPEPDEVTENPDLYYGKTIAIPGDVAEVLSPQVLRFEDGDLLVLNINPDPQKLARLNEGEKVVATGVLRRFVLAEVERDYDLTGEDAEVVRQLEVENRNKPVLIADTVYPSAGVIPRE
jgi:hypothetical protein